MLRFLTKLHVWIPVTVLAATGGYAIFIGNSGKEPELHTVGRMDLREIVQVSGTVEPAESVDLAFDVTGRIAHVYAKVGDTVRKGQRLVALDSAELAAQRREAMARVASEKARLLQFQANLDASRARLAEIEQGTRPEELALAETRVENANKSVNDAMVNVENARDKAAVDLQQLYDTVPQTLSAVYTESSDAIQNQINSLFADYTVEPQLAFATNNFQAKLDAESGKKRSADILRQMAQLIGVLNSQPEALEAALKNYEEMLAALQSFLNILALAVNESVGIDQLERNANKAKVTVALQKINASRDSVRLLRQSLDSQKVANKNSVTVAENALNEAKNAYVSAQRELDLKRAGTLQEQISAQKARVREAEGSLLAQQAAVSHAEAQVLSIDTRIGRMTLHAPMDGTVSRQDAKVGEIVAVGSAITPLVSIISSEHFEIESFISEVRIAKVAIGDSASVTLDAYGSSESFGAKVISIDPAQTLMDGVPAYRVMLRFEHFDARIKPGMTANITIMTDIRESVIAIPRWALVARNGKQFVRIFSEHSREAEWREVETGLTGSSGYVEIREHLAEGEIILLSQ